MKKLKSLLLILSISLFGGGAILSADNCKTSCGGEEEKKSCCSGEKKSD